MKHCQSKCRAYGCIFIPLAMLANLIMIAVVLFFATQAYGDEVFITLLLLIPPLLSVATIAKMGNKENRKLKKRIRTALLRKELKELSEFDESE